MTRLAIAVCCYAAVFAASLLTALLLRFDFVLTDYARSVFTDSVLIIVLLKIAVVLVSRDWHRRLRYSTFYDLVWSAAVCIISGIIIAALQIARETMPQIPRSVIANDTVISVVALASLRVLANSIRTQINQRRGPRSQRALIFASGADAISLLTAIQAGSRLLKVVGIVSPKRLNGPTIVGGVPVFSASEGLDSISRRTKAEHLLMPSNLPGRMVREVTESCHQIGIDPHLVPAVDEIHSDRFQLKTREVTIDDLLRRDPNQLDMNGIRSVIRNKVVLVTGAAGSIGSEVCRQLLQFEPRKLILLDQSEFGIFELEREINQLIKTLNRPAPTVEFILEDIVDENAMARLFMVQRPSVIFHAAAYKHVPLMESNPQAAVRNNVFGTRTLVDLADRFGIERFVMISTDKAVRPTNVMGATKLIAEHYLNAVAQKSSTRFITVRFGNVLNSAGSVVPTFRRQIAEGGPVTVTDPEMQRYFMTIPEAVQLVLQSAAVGEGGDVLILDMGEPIRIVDLAKDMIRLSGHRYPEDIDIVFTGLRPGEKLYEELFYESESNAVRVHEKIFRAPRQADLSPQAVFLQLERLTDALSGGREELRETLWQVTGFLVERSSESTPAVPILRRAA